MEDFPAATMVAVDPRHVSYTRIMYVLHATSILIGLVITASAAGWFMFFWPSIIAIVMNYLRRRRVHGTWLEAHFRWQLWTFWVSAVLIICLSPLAFTIILIRPLMAVYIAIGIWATYRIGRGWLALQDGRTLSSLRSP